MKLGDVIFYQGQRWQALRQDRESHTCTLSNWKGDQVRVPEADPECKVESQPSKWPFVAMPMKPKVGRVLEIRRGEQVLEPLKDWASSGFFSAGGTVFFNPTLRLQFGEVLTLVHERGRSRVAITRTFGTTQHKKRQATNPWRPRQPASAYDRLMGDDDPFREIE